MYHAIIVDDEYVIREGLAEGIDWNRLGFSRPIVAGNGLEALEAIRQKQPHLVITDVKMPVMDGIELCNRIRQEYPEIKTMIISGFSEFEYARKAIEYDVTAYLLKPIREETLIEQILKLKSVFDQSQLQRSGQTSFKNLPDRRYEAITLAFLSLISGNLPSGELSTEQLILHEILLSDTTACVLTFNCSNPVTDTKQIDDILTSARQFWIDHLFPVLYLNGHFLIIAYGNPLMSRPQLMQTVRRFTTQLNKSLGQNQHQPVEITFGISRPSKELTELRLLVEEALHALSQSYYDGEGQVYTCDQDCADSWSIDQAAVCDHVAKIVQSLQRQNQNDLMTETLALTRYLEAVRIADINLLLIQCINSYTMIIEEIRKDYKYLPVSTIGDIYKRFGQCHTFRALADEYRHIMFELLERISSAAQSNNKQQLVLRIKQYIKTHYQSPLSLDQLANEFFINPSYISKLFKEEAAEKLSDYITAVRLEKAKQILSSSGARIQDVASHVGYDDYRYFCTVFKKATGVTPLQYRVKSV
ncbi:MAG: response regulator [Bacillota bacterium]|nr:response regulator [Bacillota bacterium]